MPAEADLSNRALAVLDAAITAMNGSPREGQRRMAAAVAAALEGDGVLLAQAGTGTGKSLAYLSACLTAAADGRTAVISTATLALQRQVLLSDAPLVAETVAELCGVRPTIAPLKGWHNYVCRHKLTGGYPPDEEPALFSWDGSGPRRESPRSSLEDQIVQLRAWAEDTETGDRDDIAGVSDRAWRHVSVSRLECLGPACPLRADCFAERARGRAREADVVVTNHAMLGIAAAGTQGVLPEHDILVIDEAHDLVNRVTSAATVELSAGMVERCARAAAHSFDPADLHRAAADLRVALEALPEGRVVVLPPALAAAVVVVQAAVREALSAGGKDDTGARAVLKSQLLVLTEVCDRLLSDALAARRDVAWVTRGRENAHPPRLSVAPLAVDDAISEHVLAGRAVVATSATLTLGGEFEPAARALGLRDQRWHAEDFGSPFDFGRQGILYVAAHLPRPGRDGVSEQALVELGNLVEAAGGGALGLFSSLRGAQRAAEYLRNRLGSQILCQGDEPLPRLIAQFTEDPAASLMGTLSLWQGVDVPGDTCRLVVIDRIPFPRPDDPITAARTEVVEARGGNGFREVAVTHAALLLAQGAGRLIRRSADRGVVAILDSRIATAAYGRFLIRSLPPFWPTSDGARVRTSLAHLAKATLQTSTTERTCDG